MASIGAVRDRLDLEEADPRELEALGAEGLEVSVPARGSVRAVIHDMLKHLCSSISYAGARSLSEFRQQFWSTPGSVSDEAVAGLARGIVRAVT